MLVDGRFELARRDLTLAFRGSTNQRVLDARASSRPAAPSRGNDPERQGPGPRQSPGKPR